MKNMYLLLALICQPALFYATGKEEQSPAINYLRRSISLPHLEKYAHKEIQSPTFHKQNVILQQAPVRKRKSCVILSYLGFSSVILAGWGCYYLALKCNVIS